MKPNEHELYAYVKGELTSIWEGLDRARQAMIFFAIFSIFNAWCAGNYLLMNPKDYIMPAFIYFVIFCLNVGCSILCYLMMWREVIYYGAIIVPYNQIKNQVEDYERVTFEDKLVETLQKD